MMPEIGPVDSKLAVIIEVYELVCECMFHMLLVDEVALAQEHGTKIRRESASSALVARQAENMVGRGHGDTCLLADSL